MTTLTYPLSPMQQGMVFHTLQAPHSGIHLEQIVCSLREDIEVPALRNAWERVVARHEILRTTFEFDGADKLVQRVHARVQVPFTQEDWETPPVGEAESRISSFLRKDRLRSFSLQEPPLMRLALFRLGVANYCLIWTFHHVLLDGRSFPLVLKEVFGFYEALVGGRDVELPQPRSYRDYIQWLQGREVGKGERFWREKLKGFAASTPLPQTPRPQASDIDADDHGEWEIRLSASTTAALTLLALKHELTLNTLVQGAWAILLSRYSGEEDVLFGAVRACRRSAVGGAESTVGLFMNTLPVRINVSSDRFLIPWLKEIRAEHVAVREYEHTPLVNVLKWSEIPAGTPLFESILVFENYDLNSLLRSQGGHWEKRQFRLLDKTNFPLNLYAYAGMELKFKLAYDRRRFDDATVIRMASHLRSLSESIATGSDRPLRAISILSEEEKHQLLVEWNDTRLDYASDQTIHRLFEAQAARTPDATAVVFEERQVTYRELNARANQLAAYLRRLGVEKEVLVGVCLERSLEMVVALLGILKAGGAYLPLDSTYPRERLAFMIEDAKPLVVVTQKSLRELMGFTEAVPEPKMVRTPRLVSFDEDWPAVLKESAEDRDGGAKPENLAYVIYTSGSTGKPNGVMVEHCNVVNFFTGMDVRIGDGSPGVWLAVTSISFDISVLELFWTLARGFKVVVQSERGGFAVPAARSRSADKKIDFSLFYFASDEGNDAANKHRLLLEGAKFADRNGFAAVWTPERHFHAFGGLYPNPSVASAAIASITERVKIRAGSVVLPLHNPIRVAEEWALVDNLSRGRVGISFASGWQANDFVLAPQNYADRKNIMFRDIETVRKLWRGEAVPFRNGDGKEVSVKILPRPIQSELPVWVTAAAHPETFRMAGEIGAHVLTHLLGQKIEDLAEKITIYREAWKKHGHGTGEGRVTIMLHTFVGESMDAAREKVRVPFSNYLRTSVDLIKSAPYAWPLFKPPSRSVEQKVKEGVMNFTDEEVESLLSFAFERYFETSGLFGTTDVCLKTVDRLREIGADEIACLIDFGVDFESVMSSLELLKVVCDRGNESNSSVVQDYSIPAQIRRHGVTHFQCTPSLVQTLLANPGSLQSLSGVKKLMLGGEALPPALVQKLNSVVTGEIHNMYGPTETAIWSTTHRVRDGDDILIGRPIANTEIYLVDRQSQPVPIGVPGELLIGGAGVARGYLNRLELTAERFVRNPFNSDPALRLYRTGDLARYRDDGNIEFLGRIDQQVKIRGHRIELGEIEVALAALPEVREVVVAAREDVHGDKRLVAYVVPRQGANLPVALLRGFLAGKFPDFMVPSAFVFLNAVPLTPNGKVNRRALPAPEKERPELEVKFEPPANPLERELAAIWAEALEIERVGRRDNFFELGGHSLSAVQIAFKIRQAFDVGLPLQIFFQCPTLAGVAEKLQEKLFERAEESELENLVGELERLSDAEAKGLFA